MAFEVGDEVIVRKTLRAKKMGFGLTMKVGTKGVCTEKGSWQHKEKIIVYYEFVFTWGTILGAASNSYQRRIGEDEASEKLVKIGKENRQQSQFAPINDTFEPATRSSADKYELTIVSYGQITKEVDLRCAIELILADAYYPGGEDIRRLEGFEISDAIRSKTPLALGRFPLEMSRNAKKEMETLGGQVTLVLVKV